MNQTFAQLVKRHPAEVTFTGLGVWEVFALGGRLVGSVLCDMGQPPFVKGDDPAYLFAPGFIIFPKGLVPIKEGYRTDI